MGTLALSPQTALVATAHEVNTGGRVGPNAVLQLIAALNAVGPHAAAAVFARAGQTRLLNSPPSAMIEEAVPADLFRALFEIEGPRAPAIAADAGRRTADYIIANRIPGVARIMLPRLPRRLATSMLLKAIARASWTFRGSGICTVTARPAAIEIARNPLAMPHCPWHTAVFSQLFKELMRRPVIVRHPRCCLEGDDTCRFTIEWPERARS